MIDKLAGYGASIFSTMTAMAIEHNAINLAQGFPDFPVDPKLIEAVDDAMKAGYNQYARPIGAPSLHTEIEAIIRNHYHRDICSDQELTVYPGASTAIYIAIQAVINPGDEVIIFEPAYECYAPSIEIYGGLIKSFRLRPPDFGIDWEEVKCLFSDKTRLIIFNNPHNPTASTWRHDDFIALGKLVENSDCYIMSDEVYEFIDFSEGGHLSIHAYKNLWDKAIVISSFGKSLHVTGWRMGYCIAPPEVTDIMRKINQFSVFCGNHAMQVGIASYLKNDFDAAATCQLFLEKRNLVINRLKDSKWRTMPCNGTYFIMLDYSGISDMPSLEFAMWMVREHGVALIPCGPFYSDGYDPKLVRLCFAKKEETLNKALDILCKI